MNANILKRVVRAIADGSQNDLDRLATKIVEAERQTGHNKLADQLEAILKQTKPRGNGNGHSTPIEGTPAQSKTRGVPRLAFPSRNLRASHGASSRRRGAFLSN